MTMLPWYYINHRQCRCIEMLQFLLVFLALVKYTISQPDMRESDELFDQQPTQDFIMPSPQNDSAMLPSNGWANETSDNQAFKYNTSELRKLGFWDPEIELMREQYWQRTFADIRKMTQDQTKHIKRNNNDKFFSQWKLLTTSIGSTSSQINDAIGTEQSAVALNEVEESSADVLMAQTMQNGSSNTNETIMESLSKSLITMTPPRFEGFPSWERLLIDWNEDIQEYLNQVNEDQALGYSMSNYGRAPTAANLQNQSSPPRSNNIQKGSSESTTQNTTSVTTAPTIDLSLPIKVQTVSKYPMPIPAPAKEGEDIVDFTDISNKSKSILIVTTASLPWKTGTAVNPLLRAAYLLDGRKEAGGNVTLMIPWLERKVDQLNVYGANNVFDTPADQERYIRNWLNQSANLKKASVDLNIAWYTAWQNKVENSIYSMGDITASIDEKYIDICILEEPEHLNWYRAPGESWTKKFSHVVGILHTNYFSYALDQPAALIRAPAMRLLCSWMCRAHCHRVIKLSGTLDKVAPEKELVENVHGVRGTFLDIGSEVRTIVQKSSDHSIFCSTSDPTVYFIGKMLWSKGLGSLMELLKFAEESANLRVRVDMYGGGPDLEPASKKANNLQLEMEFHGPLDHAELAYSHKIFVNPSTSEVLCTTSAEALAMGKFVILPSHPSNDFFAQFPNCLTYATKEEFVAELYYAMTHSPEPLSEEYAYALSWEAATKRLEAAGCITRLEYDRMQLALSSEAAGIEIALPPIVENQESRREISKVFRYSRMRYRQFRTRLSQEIQENKVLPKVIRNRLVEELDKRLDFDIDELLDSPKLRLKLSPAELDKSLLELYDTVSESPGGDMLRLIGGGGAVALQNLYMRRHAERERWRKLKDGVAFSALDIFPTYVDEDGNEADEIYDGTPTQLIRQSLRRNLPRITPRAKSKITVTKSDVTPKMCSLVPSNSRVTSSFAIGEWNGFRPVKNSFRACNKFSILI